MGTEAPVVFDERSRGARDERSRGARHERSRGARHERSRGVRDDAPRSARASAGAPHRAAAARLFAAALLSCVALGASAAESGSPLVGREAPNFTQRSLGGTNLRLSEHRGEVVLVGFWTSWCGTCREYLERLGRLHATYGSAGLVVIGVSLDDDARRATSLLQAVDARFPNVFDARKELGPAWHVADVPMTVLVDRAGVVRNVYGELDRRDEAQLVDRIRKLLDE